MKRLRLSNAIWDSLLLWLYSSKDDTEFSLNQGEKRINWCLFAKTALTVLSLAFPCIVFALVTAALMSKVCRESFLKWPWLLAEASPLGESFTSQICKLCLALWRGGKRLCSRKHGKEQSCQGGWEEEKRFRNLLVLAGEGSVWLHSPSRLF